MARENYKQLYTQKCEELDRLQEEYDVLLSTLKDRERLQNLVSAQNALIWYNRYKEYRQTIITKKYDDEILLFEDWLEMILK
jgi:type IV secretory pathway component VirB8